MEIVFNYAPNCQDVELVMWVFCKQTTLKGIPEQGEGNITVDVDVLHFVITRGLNIRETAHGLLGEQTIPPTHHSFCFNKNFSATHKNSGQFWNTPIDIERYTGPLSDGSTRNNTYILTINYPESPPRCFPAFFLPGTWDDGLNNEYCLYAGSAQGGGIVELKSPNDSVIEGVYTEYIVPGPFSVGFRYAHFDLSECE